MVPDRQTTTKLYPSEINNGSDTVVDSLFIVALIVSGSFVYGPCFVVQYFVSLLVL